MNQRVINSSWYHSEASQTDPETECKGRPVIFLLSSKYIILNFLLNLVMESFDKYDLSVYELIKSDTVCLNPLIITWCKAEKVQSGNPLLGV